MYDFGYSFALQEGFEGIKPYRLNSLLARYRNSYYLYDFQTALNFISNAFYFVSVKFTTVEMEHVKDKPHYQERRKMDIIILFARNFTRSTSSVKIITTKIEEH